MWLTVSLICPQRLVNACCQVKKIYTYKRHLSTAGKSSKQFSGRFGVNLKSPIVFSDTFTCKARPSSFIIPVARRHRHIPAHEKLFVLDCEDIPARSDVLLCQPRLWLSPSSGVMSAALHSQTLRRAWRTQTQSIHVQEHMRGGSAHTQTHKDLCWASLSVELVALITQTKAKHSPPCQQHYCRPRHE